MRNARDEALLPFIKRTKDFDTQRQDARLNYKYEKLNDEAFLHFSVYFYVSKVSITVSVGNCPWQTIRNKQALCWTKAHFCFTWQLINWEKVPIVR
jgi:hypothetical protein